MNLENVVFIPVNSPRAQGSALRTRKGRSPLTRVAGSARTRPRRRQGKGRSPFRRVQDDP